MVIEFNIEFEFITVRKIYRFFFTRLSILFN